MQVKVYDTHIRTHDGRYLHFDVLVPEVAPRGAIGLVEPEGVRLAATRGYPEGAAAVEVGKVRPFQEARPMVHVALTGEALLLERPEAFAARYPALDPARSALGDAAVATVPVRGEAGVALVKGKRLGVAGVVDARSCGDHRRLIREANVIHVKSVHRVAADQVFKNADQV